MKKLLSLSFVLALALAAVPAFAGDAEEVQLTGWITDQWCGAKNANADGAACARACAKKGSEMALYADGKIYKISDKELAVEHIGYKVVVKGTVSDDVLNVTSIEKADEEA